MSKAVYEKKLKVEDWEEMYFWLIRDRKIQNIYFSSYDAIFEIKYLEFIEIINNFDLHKAIMHECVINMFHGVKGQKKSKLEFFKSILQHFASFIQEKNSRDKEISFLDKVILWA